MSDRMARVPLSQSLGVGQRDKAVPGRDTIGTPGGTIGLKALAAKVLKRDIERDKGGTDVPNSCPNQRSTVGQTLEPVPLVPDVPSAPPVPVGDLDERAGIIEC